MNDLREFKLPPLVPKLVPIDDKGNAFTFLGSLVAANIEMLFPKMRTGKCHLFRVTRDADFEIKEDEASDLLRHAGKREVTLTPGQTFYEGPDDVHVVGRNASSTKPAKFIAFFVKNRALRCQCRSRNEITMN